MFYLTGLAARGLTMFYADYLRIGIMYALLGLSAAAAVFLILRHSALAVRLILACALLLNLGSVIYAASAWSHSVQREQTDIAMTPIESGKVGIVVAPSSYSIKSTGEMRSIEDAINTILRQARLDPYIVVRRSYPIASEEQARRVGQRLRANIVVWRSEGSESSEVCGYHVTVLGANETMIDMEPFSLMLLMATQESFTLPAACASADSGDSSATWVVAPVAAGFGSLAVGQPVVAAAQFLGALKTTGLLSPTLSSLEGYVGTALLFANRPDLAMERYDRSDNMMPNAYARVGKGNVYIMRREWQAAVDAFNSALAIDPYHPMPYCGIGIALARERNVARAIAAYKQALALRPTWSAPYALLGLAHELEGNVSAAREAYQTCVLYAGPNIGLQTVALHRADDILRRPPTAVPTATAIPMPTATPVPTSAIYRVQRGDTLKGIADKFGVSVEVLVDVNQLDNPDAIRIGQTLIIPRKP